MKKGITIGDYVSNDDEIVFVVTAITASGTVQLTKATTAQQGDFFRFVEIDDLLAHYSGIVP